MKGPLFGLVAGASAAALLGISCASPPTKPPAPDPDQVSWAGPVDFTYLRTQYGDRDDYALVCERKRPLRELYDAAERGEWETVLEISGPWLFDCAVDIDAHFLRAEACDRVGRSIDATHHAIWYRGLVDSVLRSGAGTADDPFRVISLTEEDAVLRALDLEREAQRLVAGGVEAISARNADGERVTVHFLAEPHWRRVREALAGEE